MKKSIAQSIPVIFPEELKNLLGAERHQLILFPLLKKACSCQPLQNMMARSLDSAREHIARLEQIFVLLRMKPVFRQPEGILGIGREAEELMAATSPGSATRDAGLIMIAQRIEHYEIAMYGSLAQLARDMEQDEILEMLEATLYEEKEADELLTALAENYVNAEAGRE